MRIWNSKWSLHTFFLVLGFGHRASYTVSTTWAMPPSPFCFIFSDRVSHFCPKLTLNLDALTSASSSWDYRHEPPYPALTFKIKYMHTD
jgi:hypothetical protein